MLLIVREEKIRMLHDIFLEISNIANLLNWSLRRSSLHGNWRLKRHVMNLSI